MPNFCLIKNNKIENVIVAENLEIATDIKNDLGFDDVFERTNETQNKGWIWNSETEQWENPNPAE